jgi:hypothetical protein
MAMIEVYAPQRDMYGIATECRKLVEAASYNIQRVHSMRACVFCILHVVCREPRSVGSRV